MSYQLTDVQKRIIDGNAKAFWLDLQVSKLADLDPSTGEYLTSGHVFLYVDTMLGKQYFTDLGWFAEPDDVIDAVFAYEGFSGRSAVSVHTP